MDGDDWRDYKKYQQEKNWEGRANVDSMDLPRIKSLCKKHGLYIMQLGTFAQYRISVSPVRKKGEPFIDFWETGTMRNLKGEYTDIGGKSRIDNIRTEIKSLAVIATK